MRVLASLPVRAIVAAMVLRAACLIAAMMSVPALARADALPPPDRPHDWDERPLPQPDPPPDKELMPVVVLCAALSLLAACAAGRRVERPAC